MNILIRDLNPPAEEAVKEIKSYSNEKTNSKAVLYAVNRYMDAVKRGNKWYEKYTEMKKEFKEIQEVVEGIHYTSDRLRLLEDSKKTVDDEYSNYG